MKEKSFEKRTELLKAALDEFTARSFEEASLNTILKNVGISKGTFYYHFQDKEALYLFLLESSAKAKWEFINSRISEYKEDSESKDIFEKFKLQARIGAEFAASFPEYYKLGRMFAKEKGTKIYETAVEMLSDSSETLIEGMIRKAMKIGDFKRGFSEEFITRVLSYLFIHFDDIFKSEEDPELDSMLRNLNDFVEFIRVGLAEKGDSK